MHMLNKMSLTFTIESLSFPCCNRSQLIFTSIQNFDFTYIYCITNLQIAINMIPVSIAVPNVCYFS